MSIQLHVLSLNVSLVTEPESIKDALEGDFADEWKEATDSEFKLLMNNQTWDLVDLYLVVESPLEGNECLWSNMIVRMFQSQTGCKELFTNTWC